MEQKTSPLILISITLCHDPIPAYSTLYLLASNCYLFYSRCPTKSTFISFSIGSPRYPYVVFNLGFLVCERYGTTCNSNLPQLFINFIILSMGNYITRGGTLTCHIMRRVIGYLRSWGWLECSKCHPSNKNIMTCMKKHSRIKYTRITQ